MDIEKIFKKQIKYLTELDEKTTIDTSTLLINDEW